jgi:APA family basic amino acid/polyamine antiporter
MQPFDKIDPHAPFPTAFRSTPRPLYSIVSVGPLISLSGALFTSIYSTARIVYTMANDGLLFAPLAAISSRTHVPHTATLFTLFLSVLLIIVIDVPGLVGFTDITGFLTYSLTALALLTVR